MASVQGSAARAATELRATSSGEIPGDVTGALEDMSIPSYAIDRYGIIRWLNPAAQKLLGDVRGKQQSSVVAPEQARLARESFLRKVMGTERSTDAEVVLVDSGGERVQVDISSVPLRDGGRIVGVFGIVAHRKQTPPPNPHPDLTPRQSEVLHLLSHGRSTVQIAEELHVSVDTVRNHVRRMLRTLDAHSRIEAIAVAHRDGILRQA
jgi:PAS domain S-box-containing protein